MRFITTWLVMIFATIYAYGESGNASEHHFQGSNAYFVITTTDIRAFLDLRSYENDRVVQSVVMYSPLSPPSYETTNVVVDDDVKFQCLVFATDAFGTGFYEKHLKIYGIIRNNIRKLGDFIVDAQYSWPTDDPKDKTIKGEVSFPEMNRINYLTTQVITQNGKANTNRTTETYFLNHQSKKFEKTKSPNQTSDGIRQPADGLPKPSK